MRIDGDTENDSGYFTRTYLYPHSIHIFGVELSVWNATLLAGVILGYGVLVASFRLGPLKRQPSFLWFRYAVTAYVSVLGAQLFSYAFDEGTSFLPPASSISWANYYLNPVFGPKTLYGAILALPFGAALISLPLRDVRYRDALDHWTPTMFFVIGIARVGCFLQGCCYGIRNDFLGIAFRQGSVAYHEQVRAGLIRNGDAGLPVLPVQALCAAVLFAIALWSLRRLQRAQAHVFVHSVALYSAYRFLAEFVRADASRGIYAGLSSSQWIALTLLAAYACSRNMRERSQSRASDVLLER